MLNECLNILPLHLYGDRGRKKAKTMAVSKTTLLNSPASDRSFISWMSCYDENCEMIDGPIQDYVKS